MSQVLPIRPGVVVAGGGAAARVHVVLEPETPIGLVTDIESSAFELSVEATGIAGLTPMRRAARLAAMVVEVDPAQADTFAQFESLARELAGTTPIIAAVRDLTVAATRLVLRAGAADVLPLPFAADELVAVLQQIQGPVRETRPGTPPARHGKVIATVGAVGGCGATTVAVQTALAWAGRESVCVLDLDVQFGNAALYLNLKPELSLTDVLEAGERLDTELLQTIAVKHASGLNLIASPPEMSPLDLLSPAAVGKIIALARQVFDVIIVDLPRAWLDWTVTALQVSDVVLLVAPLSVPGVHQTRRQLEVIEANGLLDKTRLVLNRVATPLFGKIDLRETQSLIGRRIDYTIGNDYPTVSTAIDEGKPFSAVKSRSRVEKDVRALITALAATLVKAEAA